MIRSYGDSFTTRYLAGPGHGKRQISDFCVCPCAFFFCNVLRKCLKIQVVKGSDFDFDHAHLGAADAPIPAENGSWEADYAPPLPGSDKGVGSHGDTRLRPSGAPTVDLSTSARHDSHSPLHLHLHAPWHDHGAATTRAHRNANQISRGSNQV